MKIDLLKIFEMGVDYGLLLAEEERIQLPAWDWESSFYFIEPEYEPYKAAKAKWELRYGHRTA